MTVVTHYVLILVRREQVAWVECMVGWTVAQVWRIIEAGTQVIGRSQSKGYHKGNEVEDEQNESPVESVQTMKSHHI